MGLWRRGFVQIAEGRQVWAIDQWCAGGADERECVWDVQMTDSSLTTRYATRANLDFRTTSVQAQARKALLSTAKATHLIEEQTEVEDLSMLLEVGSFLHMATPPRLISPQGKF